MEHISYT